MSGKVVIQKVDLDTALAALIFTGGGILLLDGWARLKYQGVEVQLVPPQTWTNDC